MNAKDTVAIVSQLHQTADQVALEREAEDEVTGVSKIVVGRRWFVILFLALLQIFLAPLGWLPYLKPDGVHLKASTSWLYWVGFIACAVAEYIPHVRGTRTMKKGMRFVLSALQGFALGHLMEFGFGTLLFRFCLAMCLGAANAFDQLSRIKKVKKTMENAPVRARRGAQGKCVDCKGVCRECEVAEVHDDGHVTINFMGGLPGKKQSSEKVSIHDERLELTHYSKEALDAVMAEAEKSPGFETRPWGFCIGVTAALWIQEGFGKSDSFVTGMLSGQLLFFLSIPVTLWIVWWAWKKSSHPAVRALCLLVFIGACVFDIIAILPVLVGATAFGGTEMITHQIVVYIAIPMDYFIFTMKARKLQTLEDVATLGLKHVVRKADKHAPEEVKNQMRMPLLR